MSRARGLFTLALFSLGAANASARQQQAGSVSDIAAQRHAAAPPAGDVRVRASLSRTALWLGDRVTYELLIACAPNVDVIADDLLPEKLPLTGLEALGSERERRVESDGGIAYRVHYRLAAYDVTAPVLRVGDMTLRYFVRRAGQSVEDAAPAGDVRVAGSLLALRSTLPDDRTGIDLRDAREAVPLPVSVTSARPVGLALVVLSAAPVALWAATLVRRAHATRKSGRERVRQTRDVTASALLELRAADVAKDAERRAAYDRLDALLRRQLAHALGIPALALTASEISERLSSGGERLAPEAVAEALQECERARYGAAQALPSEERFRSGLLALEGLLARTG